VTVVHGDVATLQLGREVPHKGASVVVFDLFDAGAAACEPVFHQAPGLAGC
jgi:hypothetical protein